MSLQHFLEKERKGEPAPPTVLSLAIRNMDQVGLDRADKIWSYGNILWDFDLKPARIGNKMRAPEIVHCFGSDSSYTEHLICTIDSFTASS